MRAAPLLSAQAQVTNTELKGVLNGNITDDEEAYYSKYVATEAASDGASSIKINPLTTPIFKGTTIIFTNGSTFKVSEEAKEVSLDEIEQAGPTQLFGELSGDISVSESGFTHVTGSYNIGMLELPTGIVAQHYHGIGEGSENIVIDWTPKYTAPYFIEIGTHWGDKGDYNISMAKLDSIAEGDYIGETKEEAREYNFGQKVTSVMDYGGDRDWYKVQMIPGESYKIDLEGDANLSYNRQSPLIRVYDEYGKPKGDLWQWYYNRNWGKPGGGYDEDSKNSNYVYSVPQNRFENNNQPIDLYLT